jgi:hypothetical protein
MKTNTVSIRLRKKYKLFVNIVCTVKVLVSSSEMNLVT